MTPRELIESFRAEMLVAQDSGYRNTHSRIQDAYQRQGLAVSDYLGTDRADLLYEVFRAIHQKPSSMDDYYDDLLEAVEVVLKAMPFSC